MKAKVRLTVTPADGAHPLLLTRVVSVQQSTVMNSNLHSAQSHPTLRKWQCRATVNHAPEDFVLPLFVISDDDGCEEIASMPGKRDSSLTLLFYSPFSRLFRRLSSSPPFLRAVTLLMRNCQSIMFLQVSIAMV